MRAWNPATRRPVGAPIQIGSGPADALNVVAFSSDGKLLAGGSSDDTVLRWQVSLFTHTYARLAPKPGRPAPRGGVIGGSASRGPEASSEGVTSTRTP